MTKTSLIVQIVSRPLELYLSVDLLVVPANYGFTIESTVINHDYNGQDISYKWQCRNIDNIDQLCNAFHSETLGSIIFKTGLTYFGSYEIILNVDVSGQTAAANATIIIMDSSLPVIQVTPTRRILNEGSEVTLTANVSHVSPGCTLTWYFTNTGPDNAITDLEECKHGAALSDSLTIYSLEESFLNELTDFSNESEWRQVSSVATAAEGHARFVADCNCLLTFNCIAKGTVYADIYFKLNTSPVPADLMVSPESGSAMETLFRISTLAAVDADRPLRYSFYTNIGAGGSLLLASFLEHLAFETLLPYYVDGTFVWVEVCDALGACSRGARTSIHLTSGTGRTIESLLEDIRAHVARCELIALRKVVVSSITTYKFAGQIENLSKLTTSLVEALPPYQQLDCAQSVISQYKELMIWFNSTIFESDLS